MWRSTGIPEARINRDQFFRGRNSYEEQINLCPHLALLYDL